MEIKDRLRLRELQTIIFLGLAEYPNDKERLEQMFVILEKFIDSIVERECSKLFSKNVKLKN